MAATLSINFLRALAASCGWLACSALATPPLVDYLEIQGQRGVFQGWLQLPISNNLEALRNAERCSARGGPRGNFRVEAGKLWLDSLYRCGGKIEIKEVYSDEDTPIFANWVTGNLIAEVGEPVCWSDKTYTSILETQISMQVQAGAVVSIQRKSNVGHPDCRRVSP
jgi:hypothetical protein